MLRETVLTQDKAKIFLAISSSAMLPLAILALAAGPLLFRLAKRSPASLAVLDGFVRVAVAGLILVHVLPWAWKLGGWSILFWFIGGMLLPLALHRAHSASGRGLGAEIGMSAFALALHAFFDGTALGPRGTEGSSSQMLSLAVVLHRLPVGLGIWWLIRPRFGLKTAWFVLALLALATAAGAFASSEILEGAAATWVAFLQALIAGALLHVVLGHSISSNREHFEMPSALGGLVAIGLLSFLSTLEGSTSEHALLSGFWDTFLSLTSQSAPALLAASVTIMLTKAFVPGSMMRFFHGRSSVDQALRGTVAGLPIPICSCGVVPVYRGLVEAGAPPPASLAFLVAAPEVGWAAILLSIGLLGVDLTVARVGSAALLAIVVGIVVGRFVQPKTEIKVEEQSPQQPLALRLREGFQYGFKTIVDDTAPWILAGLLLAAAVEPALQTGWLAELPTGVDILLATLIGLPLYVCASGSTPLVAILLAKGLSPGAGIAFLLTGPATNLTTAGLLSSLHGKKVAVVFGLTMVLMAVAVGFGVNAVLGPKASPSAVSAIHHHPATSGIIFAGLLGIVYLASLLRQGVPGFIGKVIRPHAEQASPQESPSEKQNHCCSN